MTTKQQQSLRSKVLKANTLNELMDAAKEVYDFKATLTQAKKYQVNLFFETFFQGCKENAAKE